MQLHPKIKGSCRKVINGWDKVIRYIPQSIRVLSFSGYIGKYKIAAVIKHVE